MANTMLLEYHSVSGLINDVSFSGNSSLLLVCVTDRIAFGVCATCPGVWGAIGLLAGGAFMYLFRENIPTSWLCVRIN
jgi:hypothetical protein